MKLNQSKTKNLNGKDLKIAIILPRFNDNLGALLSHNTEEALKEYGVQPENIELYRVPGALEIPFLAKKLARSGNFNSIIALGIVVRGDTPHFDYVCQETYRALMDINLHYETPVIFGVLTVDNYEQALERVEKEQLNKGKDFAEAAIEMGGFKI